MAHYEYERYRAKNSAGRNVTLPGHDLPNLPTQIYLGQIATVAQLFGFLRGTVIYFWQAAMQLTTVEADLMRGNQDKSTCPKMSAKLRSASTRRYTAAATFVFKKGIEETHTDAHSGGKRRIQP